MIAGCEAGSNAPIQQWHQPTRGVSDDQAGWRTASSAINNVFVLGAPVNASPCPRASSAGLFLATSTPAPRDRLIRVSAPGAATAVTCRPEACCLAAGQRARS